MVDDGLNLRILEDICAGEGVEINISALSKAFKKHRNTIKSKINALMEHGIIDKPAYPFMHIHQEYPLLVVANADLPRTEKIDEFLRDDPHIFAAFYVREDEFNTIVIEYHKDLYTYGEWRKMLVGEEKIPPRRDRYPAQSQFFSNKHIFKYAPYSAIYKLEERVRLGEDVVINGLKVDKLSFQILKMLMLGEGIRTNENFLSQKHNTHRKTIERRIETMIEEGVITKPVCRFSKFFSPPNQIVVLSLIEVTCNARDKIMKSLKSDPSIPIAMEANTGRYTFLVFGTFADIEEHIHWEEKYNKRFPNCLGAIKASYLSPIMAASIDQKKVSLGIIRDRLKRLDSELAVE